MIKLDGSLVIQIANFVILIWILNLVLYKPLRKMLLQRKEVVKGLEESIETSNQGAKEKDESLVSGLKSARQTGLQERDTLVSSAEDEEKKIIHDIHAKAQEELAAVREKIAADAGQVRTSLQQEVDGFARSIGQKILGRPVE